MPLDMLMLKVGLWRTVAVSTSALSDADANVN